MASKSKVVVRNVYPSDTVESAIIPSGRIWKFHKFGAVDIDNTGSVYVLQKGSGSTWETLRIISVYGGTKELEYINEFTGDGTFKFRVQMLNQGSSSKQMAFWYDLTERQL